MKFAGLFVKYVLAAALVIPSFASAQESPPDLPPAPPALDDPAMEPLHESNGALTPPSSAPAPNAAAQELGEVKKEKKKKPKKSAKKEVKKSKKADKHHKKDGKKAKKNGKKKKKHDNY